MMVPTGRRGEMVDALDSKSGILTDVSVRVRPSVLLFSAKLSLRPLSPDFRPSLGN